jgi:hypothetical protein
MRCDRLFPCLFVFWAATLAPTVAAQSGDAMAAAHRLVVRSGISVQLRGFHGQLAGQLAQQRGKVPDALIAELTNAAKEAYRPEILQQDIVEGLAKKLKVDEMDRAVAWLETDVGKRVTLAEELASATADEETLRKYAESPQGRKPPAARARLVGEILAATYAEDSAVRSLQAISLGVALGMDSAQPAQKRLGLVRLQAQLKAAMPAELIKQQMREVLPLSYSYTYRDISEADLAAYLAFLRTPVGKRYSEQAMDAFMESLIRASVRLGQLVDVNTTRRPT